MFRWRDLNDSGSDHGLAIDNVRISYSLSGGESPPPSTDTGLYWAGTSGSGGAGTWSASSATFATDATFASTNLPIGATGTVVFAGATAGTVTIDGGVSVASGLRFSTNGYTLSSSTLTLGGASASANTLTVDADVTATIGSELAGTSGLTKAGAGTLVLTGANTYTGGTTVSAGTLTVNTTSLSGNVANSGNVTFDQASDATYAGAITGTGTLTKAGAGNLTLTSANAPAGGTTISAGTLTVSTASLSGAIANNAALVFDQASDGTYAGAITGTGTLTKAGAGNLTLSGANAFSGGTTLSAGTLTVSTASLPGSIANNAALVFNQAAVGTYAGAITGTGSLTKSGAGNLTLSGANAHTGGTTISAGTLTVSTASISGAIANNAALVFDQAEAGTYAGALSGAGTLAKSGSGALTLSGDNSGFSGATTIAAGSLVATNANALGSGAVTVNGGALQLAAGITIANSLTVGAIAPGQRALLAGWDFQTTTNGGTAAVAQSASTTTPKLFVANFGSGTLYLDGTNGSSDWQATTSSLTTQLNAFAGTNIINTSDFGSVFSTSTSGASSLAVISNPTDARSMVFAFDMSGLSNLQLSYAARWSSDTAYDTHAWSYSTDGLNWISASTLGAGLSSSFSLFELGTVSALDGASTAFLRLTLSGADATSSNNRLDNFLVTAETSPAAGGSGTLGLAEAGTATFSGNIAVHGAATLHAAADATVTFSGILSESGSLAKTGAGTVVLSSANTFTGGVTVSAGTLLIGNVAALGAGSVLVSGGVLDLADLAPTNVIVLAGGSLANAAAWGSTGTVQVSGSADATTLNDLPTAEVTIAPGATVDLTGVTKDIVFDGGSLSNLAGFQGKIRVTGNLDVSGGDHAGELEVGAGGTVNFGNRSSSRSVKFTGGSISGANFTGNIEVVGSGIALTSGIAAGQVRLSDGNSASIQAGFNRNIRLEGGSLTGLNNYAGELTVAAPTFSTTGITTSATIMVESGSTLKGSGTIGGLTQVAGSALAPGNSPGMLNVTGTHVLAGGASMEVEFIDPSTIAGLGYDAVTAGTLDLSSLSTSSRYILKLISLAANPDVQGALDGFDPSQPYVFNLFSYTDILLPAGYTGSLNLLFAIDTSDFLDSASNSVSAAAFSVADNGSNTLQLVYTPIPEPSTYGLALGGLALAAAALRRRKRI